MADIALPRDRKKFVCDKDTKKVHNSEAQCPQIDQHRICEEFDDLRDALDAGYVRCSGCLPLIPQFVGPSPVAIRRVEGMRYEVKHQDNQRETKILNGPPMRKG
jgi:hypothetical protein